MQSAQHITLTQLQMQIKAHLEADFALPVWVVAELADVKTNRTSGHCYMELVEKGGANGMPSAQVRAVVWRTQWTMLSAHFRAATGADLAIGMRVLLCVKVSYHELYGLSLVVVDIDPAYTLGDLAAQREAVIAQLKADGVWDMNREAEMALVPQRIAVVSSPQAAGYQDFLNELNGYEYAFRVELFDALMQGERAESSIISALECTAERIAEFDAVVIIRGGGSQSDLNFLNSYALAANVAQFPLPVIAGLGHDKDQSVIDLVAHRSLKTPTAVAQFFVQRAVEVDASLDGFEASIGNRAAQATVIADQQLTTFATLLASYTRQTIVRSEVALAASQALLAERLARIFTTVEHRLAIAETALKAADPAAILARGFAIVRSSGKVLRSADDASKGSQLEITLANGTITAVSD